MDTKVDLWNSIIINMLSKEHEGERLCGELVLKIDEERQRILEETHAQSKFMNFN